LSHTKLYKPNWNGSVQNKGKFFLKIFRYHTTSKHLFRLHKVLSTTNEDTIEKKKKDCWLHASSVFCSSRNCILKACGKSVLEHMVYFMKLWEEAPNGMTFNDAWKRRIFIRFKCYSTAEKTLWHDWVEN